MISLPDCRESGRFQRRRQESSWRSVPRDRACPAGNLESSAHDEKPAIFHFRKSRSRSRLQWLGLFSLAESSFLIPRIWTWSVSHCIATHICIDEMGVPVFIQSTRDSNIYTINVSIAPFPNTLFAAIVQTDSPPPHHPGYGP